MLAAWVAEMDFGLAPSIASALHDAVDRGLTGYSYPDAEEAVARAAAGFWHDRFDWRVDPSWVFPAPDVIEGIVRVIIHLTRPGSPVVLHTPVYFPFFSMVEWAGREIIEAPSLRAEDGRYGLDLGSIERGLAAGAGSVVLCNPWNPTGRVFEESELSDLLAVAAEHDARVIVDEIHGPITFTGVSHLPLATLDADRAITVTAASKAWNLPGLKCAQVVLTNERDRAAWADHFEPHLVGAGTFGLVASEAAYSGGRDWFDGVLATLADNRRLLAKLIDEQLPEVRFALPEGTYLGWLDMSAYGLDNPNRFIRENARVALTSGWPFRGDGDQNVRLNFATEPEILIEIVERIGTALSHR
ncbi:MAG TPA: aminotransferase class I/II-fold pyridoxal phosphate-dependent enzyme [Acidimicrobiia bacterium]|nr:aminotransferase class I/II-fold pyridoxal phosphate-dependent enzyme [Acidimicrobiia bacterium]